MQKRLGPRAVVVARRHEHGREGESPMLQTHINRKNYALDAGVKSAEKNGEIR